MENPFDKISQWRNDELTIVFTNGCFDLLHPGHLQYLHDAADLGDKLIIGLNDDESVKRLKGNDRPINSLSFRQAMLSGLRVVDLVIPFSEDTPINLIIKIKPDFLVKGGDYTIEEVVGGDIVSAHGGEVRILSFMEGFSTSSLIEKIKHLNHDDRS